MKNGGQFFSVVRLGTLAVVLGLVALGLLLARDLIANQFATSYGLTIGLWIQDRGDRPRLERALASLTVPDDVNASYAFDRNGWSRSQIEVSAPTREKAVAAARTLGDIVTREFDSAGDSKLEVSVPSRAYPEDNAATTRARTAIMYGAPVAGSLAIGLFVMAWRQGRRAGVIPLPAGAGFIIAAVAFFWIALTVLPGWLFMAVFAMMIPTSIAGMIVYKMNEVRRASRWPSAQGRIVRSRTRTVTTKQSDGSSARGNLPDIEYAFSVDGTEYRSTRISIGEILPNTPEVEAALERYQVGRTGPVFYNPANPREAVLEREAPASSSVMYAIAGGVMVVGLAVVVAFTRLSDIIEWLQPHFPPGAVVHAFLFFLACGLVTSLILISNLAEARSAWRWPAANGTVITSRAEERRELVPRGSGQTITVWSPLVEYTYRVGDREYHGTRIAFGPLVSGGRELAESQLVPYPVGASVTVHHDPANPSSSVLQPRIAFAWPSLLITLGFFAAAFFFSGRV
jgi:hypothetical protein